MLDARCSDDYKKKHYKIQQEARVLQAGQDLSAMVEFFIQHKSSQFFHFWTGVIF
jgi:hypothetical protein